MSTPIGKGSRFRVLTGEHRGREMEVIGKSHRDEPGWWRYMVDGEEYHASTGRLDSVHFQRLADAPPERDALLVEIEAEIKRLDIRPEEGGAYALDAIASVASMVTSEGASDTDEEWEAAIRATMLECAAYAVAGLREIDRRAK